MSQPPSNEPPDNQRDEIEELLSDCIDDQEETGGKNVDRILAAAPEHADTVRKLLQSLNQMGLVDEGTPAASPPRSLGEYDLLRELGAGGMGIVYLARQKSVSRLVALKVIHPFLSQNDRIAERFRREARTVAKLRHPHLVTLYQAGEDQQRLYMAMEFIPGASLAQLQRDHAGALPVRDVLRWGLQIAQGLAYAHENGVIHRDVKPSNILITPQRDARLLDFGLARDEELDALTRTGDFQGTPYYAAPESVQAVGGQVGPHSDVYSLGVLLYEALAGRVPYAGQQSGQVFYQILHGTAVPLRTINSDIPPDVQTVVQTAMAREPNGRYSSAALFADDLQALLEFRPIRARPPGVARRLLLWTRRNRALATTVLAAVTLILAVLVGFAVRDSRRQRTRQVDAIAELSTAQRSLQQYQANYRVVVGESKTLEERRATMISRYETESSWRDFSRAERELQGRRDAAEDAFLRVLQHCDTSEQLGVSAEQTAAIRAEAYLLKWQNAHEENDATLAAFYKRKVQEFDRAGRFRAELEGESTCSFSSEPSGADLYLFRYELQSDHGDEGDARLVPIPWPDAPSPIMPGTWCLQIRQTKGAVHAGDLVVALNDHPIRDCMLVTKGNGSIQVGDRVISANGVPMRTRFDASVYEDYFVSQIESPPVVEFEFESAGERYRKTGCSWSELGIAVSGPETAARRGGLSATILRFGELLIEKLPAGLDLNVTAAAPMLHPEGLVGKSPMRGDTLPSGAYLAVFVKPGYCTTQVPFDVDFGRSVMVETELIPDDVYLPGFVPIGWSVDEVATPFWLQRREVTMSEYIEFLEDPEVLERIRAADEPILFPRERENMDHGGFIGASRNGPFATLPGFGATPVVGVTWDDANDYATWRTEQAIDRGEPWTFRLPSVAEFEAVRQASRFRVYPHGRSFRPLWYKGYYARKQSALESSALYPIDHVPPGIFGLAGGVSEWTSDSLSYAPQLRWTVGGCWMHREPHFFELDYKMWVHTATAANKWGFRLVATHEEY